MARPLRTLAAAAAALAAACVAALPAQATPAQCGAGSYSYAGVRSATTAFGVGAGLTAMRPPSVPKGHVAGWVGVGGVGLGPDATDVWLQVGISATAAVGQALYYEVAQPNQAPRYVMLKGHVPVGVTFHVAVLEDRARRDSWRVWVNGTAMTNGILLPGSHAAWKPIVTAESWSGDSAGACNGYAFRFEHVRVATVPGGGWQPMTASNPQSDPGYELTQGPHSLLAASAS